MNKPGKEGPTHFVERIDDRCGAFPLLTALRERVVVVDGAMGTMLHSAEVSADDYEGRENCIEILNSTRPDLIGAFHAAYFEAGADLVLTNTLGSMPMVLAEFGIAERARELSRLGAEVARRVASDYSSKGGPRWVGGSVGATTKMLSLSQVTFDEQFASYREQIGGLLEGGIDAVVAETQFDLLNLKCLIAAARRAMRDVGREVPICAHVTLESSGTMLTGSDIAVALAVLESMEVDVVGINCATGPDQMQDHVRYLGEHSTQFVSVMPNAGIPRNVNGKAEFDLGPTGLADYLEKFVSEYGVNMVGGCCGTTPAHTRAMSERVARLGAPRRKRAPLPDRVTSLYTVVNLTQSPPPLIIGERTNATGSKRFRELLLREDWDGMVEMAQEAVAEGAHLLDVSTAYASRDEVRDMTELLRRLATQVSAPLLLDTTQPDVMEAGLKLVGGRAILNSVNLEDGERKANRVFELARQFGCSIVALTIDEEGMARTAERKIAIARRLYEIATRRHGIQPGALLFDPLTFPITSGEEESRKAAVETLAAIQGIKALPGARVMLGVSNVSFGLQPRARRVLNSVFLAEALELGLDAAILDASKIRPLTSMASDAVALARDVVFDRRREGFDPLLAFVDYFRSEPDSDIDSRLSAVLPIEERVRTAVIEGKKREIEALLLEALNTYSPVQIVNNIVLEAMRTVGERFGSGKMHLPFVLQAAETTKAAVAYLSRFMDRAQEVDGKGVIVLATVRGDVHDIGKNLVNIILSNNGYRVVDLGIKVPIEEMVRAADQHKADAIGMSGLLVKSTMIMKDNLQLMADRGYSIPVIVGGAALNREHVDGVLSDAYRTGEVYFGADAFTGLELMEELCGHREVCGLTGPWRLRAARKRAEEPPAMASYADDYAVSDVRMASSVPAPPFWGTRIVDASEISLAEVFELINRQTLFRYQWQYRRGRRAEEEYRHFLAESVEPKLRRWWDRAVEGEMFRASVVYGYFPCNSSRNEVIVYHPEGSSREALLRFRFPRQAAGRRLCIADFFRSIESGERDVIALQLVTMGPKAAQNASELLSSNCYEDYLHLHGLSVEATEALAELWHRRVRQELKIASQDGKTSGQLLHHVYQGARYSFGYPACPRLEDQQQLFSLLRPERIGVTMTETFELVPEQSTSAVICHHPAARYFNA